MSGSQTVDLAISSGTCTHIWHSPGLPASHLTSLSHDGLVNTSRWNQNNRVVVTAGASGQLALNYVTGTVMGVLPPQQDNTSPAVNTEKNINSVPLIIDLIFKEADYIPIIGFFIKNINIINN